MSLNIKTNMAAMEAQRNIAKNQAALTRNFTRLSSGYRINTAADDAAGLAISESMKSRIRSYAVAERNASDGISMAQTAEGSLGEVHDILGRMRELAMQAANGSMGNTDRGNLDIEFTALKDEMTRIQNSTKYNGNDLVGVTATPVMFQVGLNDASSDQITLTFGGLGLGTVLSSAVTTASSALSALSEVDAAIQNISSVRASFGAAMNRMETTISSIQTMRLNYSAANARIRDVDVAEEAASLARNQVLAQAGVTVLAQANQIPQSALNLLR